MAKEKKKSLGGVAIGGAAILALLFLLGHGGGGAGSGTGTTTAKPNNDTVSSQSVVVEKPAATQAQKTVLEVTVSGRDYLYENNRIGLETLIGELSKHGKDAEIRISSDETATINAMDALTDRLDEAGFTNYSKK